MITDLDTYRILVIVFSFALIVGALALYASLPKLNLTWYLSHQQFQLLGYALLGVIGWLIIVIFIHVW